jgi:hypothetical protein
MASAVPELAELAGIAKGARKNGESIADGVADRAGIAPPRL